MSCYSNPAVRRRTGEREAATPDQPRTPATAARAPRCLRLVERSSGIKIKPPERCANEALPDSRLCAAHLAEAVREWNEILAAHAIGEVTP